MDATGEENSCSRTPVVSRRLAYWFDVYLQRYIPRHFHAFAISNAQAAEVIPAEQSLLVYMNHASWWDPISALVLSKRYFPDRQFFAPIDALALRKYPFMQRLGFFPVEQSRLQGAGHFLSTVREIMGSPNAIVWLTPEGKFADPRDRRSSFEPGLSHLVSKMDDGFALPLAMEYPFWEERLPEALARFGEPISIASHGRKAKGDWQTLLQDGLRDSQRRLEDDSLARRSDAFDVLLSGKSGVGWVYDLLRRFRSLFSGTKIETAHGDKLQ